MKILRGDGCRCFQRFSAEINAFVVKQKNLGESKTAKTHFIPLLSMKKAEVCFCAEGKQKPEHHSGQAVNPLKPGVIHRNSRANGTSCCKTEL